MHRYTVERSIKNPPHGEDNQSHQTSLPITSDTNKNSQELGNDLYPSKNTQHLPNRSTSSFIARDDANPNPYPHDKYTLKIKPNNVQLKLYYRYEYTRPYIINRIWSLKQLGHAWFHLPWLRWPVRSGEGAQNSKWKHVFPAGFEPTPRQSMTGKSAP